MFIWRVENLVGQGCYINQPTRELLFRHRFSICHPTPLLDDEINRLPYPSEISGFKNYRQALNWFSDIELQVLERIGFQLKEVGVKRITAESKYQVLALRKGDNDETIVGFSNDRNNK
jgi:hypothetical protein